MTKAGLLHTRAGTAGAITQDTVRPRHPFSTVRTLDETASVEQKLVGGLGIVLVGHMGNRLVYSYTEGRNRISLVVSDTL